MSGLPALVVWLAPLLLGSGLWAAAVGWPRRGCALAAVFGGGWIIGALCCGLLMRALSATDLSAGLARVGVAALAIGSAGWAVAWWSRERSPLHGPVTSEYGYRWGALHPGIDIAPPYGTPIAAAKSGVVIQAGPYYGYGNFVMIDHGGGMVTGYGHQSRIAVTQGQTVRQGQIIGYVGSTGDSTGPHLHFEVRINGATQNPRSYMSGNP